MENSLNMFAEFMNQNELVASLVLNSEFKIAYYNKFAFELTKNYIQEELKLQSSFIELFPEKIRNIVRKKLKSVLIGTILNETITLSPYSKEIYLSYHAYTCQVNQKKYIFISFFDITNLKQQDGCYNTMEQRFRKAEQIANIGSWEYNVQTKEFWGSEGAKRIYGFEPSSSTFSVEDVESCIPDRENVHQALLDLINDGKEYNLEFEIINKSIKQKRIIRSIAEVKKDDSGNPIRVTGIIQDVTVEKEAKKKLEESKERFRLLSNVTFEGIVIHKKGILIDANDSFLSLTGYTRKEALGANLFDYILSEEERKLVMNKMVQSHAKPYVINAIRKDKSIFKAELEARNIMYDGEEIRIVAVRDVSERVENEKALKVSEERFKYLFNAAPISIWEEDFSRAYHSIHKLKQEGVTDFVTYFNDHPEIVDICSQRVKILDINETTLTMFNAKSKDVLLKNLRSIFTQDSLENFKGQLVQIAHGETEYFGECENKTIDGKVLHVALRWNVAPGYEKDYSRVLVSLIDITERELAERKVHSLLKEKEMLLHEVHHRIKNNMVSIEGLLKLQARRQKNEQVKDALQDAKSRVQSMRVLYDKLYRSDNFKEISLQTYLPPLIKEIVSMFPNRRSVMIKDNIQNIIVSAKLTFSLGILINELITNSMKYAFPDTKGNEIEVNAIQKGTLVELSVQDNGLGLPNDFDIHNSTGFGMKLIQILTQQMKADINFETDNGTKCTVVFSLNNLL